MTAPRTLTVVGSGYGARNAFIRFPPLGVNPMQALLEGLHAAGI